LAFGQRFRLEKKAKTEKAASFCFKPKALAKGQKIT